MARYASALLRGGDGIVQPETFREMTSPQYCPEPALINWGLGFIRTPRFGRTLIGHGGAYYGGWNSSFAVLPEEDIAILIHMNIMMDRPAPIFRRLQSAVLDVQPSVTPNGAAASNVLASAPGMYELTMPGTLTNFRPATRVGRVQIEREGDGLRLRSRWGGWKRGVRLQQAARDNPLVFAVETDDPLDAETIVFTRDAHGAIDGLRCDELVRMVKTERTAIA
jgi:hypothetical protein